jgi:hypothetical protein
MHELVSARRFGAAPAQAKATWSPTEMAEVLLAGAFAAERSRREGLDARQTRQKLQASAGKAGPIAWQMHNAGLFDEYKDVTIELDPKEDDLITVK